MKKLKFKINNEEYIYDDKNMTIYKNNYITHIQEEPTSFNSSYLNSINLVTNQTCNMKCDYCYANGGSFNNKGKIMNFAIAKKAIDLLFLSLKQNKSNTARIGFIGGEPLLNFKLIDQVVNYVNENYSEYKIKWSIITNFTLINDKIFKFLKQNKFKVVVSIDGNKSQHNLHRKYINGLGTYDDVIKNIKKYGEDLNIKVRGTITNDNYDVYSFIIEMLKHNIKNISFGYDVFLTNDNYKKFKNSYNKLIKKYYEDIENDIYYNIDNISNYILKIVLKTKKDFNCNSGISYRAISPTGNTYLCHRFIDEDTYKYKNLDDLDLNSLKDEIEEFKIIRNEKTNNLKCKNCYLKNICGGTCFHNSFITKKNIFEINDLDCIIKKDFIISSIKLITKMEEDTRKKYILEIIKIKNK